MSDTILSSRWVVYYEAENRQKRIVRDTAVTPATIDTVNTLYSALQGHFDELTQMDDGVPMSAQTPTEYTIGIIDAGDKDPWFIDRTSAEYLKGGAIKTASWARTVGTNTGIIRMAYTQTVALVAGDIGKDVLMTVDLDRGTLLDFNDTGATKYMWIRPDSNAAANSFDNTPTAGGAWTIVSGTGTGSQAGGTATTGESLWANIYNTGLANLESFTHQYVYQNGAYLKKYKSTTIDWWGDGQIDILINVKELSSESDEGYLTVFARQYSKTYDNFIVDLTAGGRNPIPLATGADLNNTTGFRKFTGSVGVNTFNAGNYIYWTNAGAYTWTTTTKRGKITAVAGTVAAPEITYYLLGDLTDFVSTDTIKEYTGTADGDATCTSGAPANVGPANLTTPPIVTHASNATYDIDENGTNENYSIVIDLNSNPVADGYEWTKYVTRRGGTTTTATDGIEGERYIGSDYRLVYTGTVTGTLVEGDTVSQAVSLATGTVVAKNLTAKIFILRNSRLTFNTTGLVTGNQGGTFTPDSAATAIAPIKAAPFGTFAGGTWFAAPGVVFGEVLATEANKYQLTDDNGNVVKAPVKVTITVGNTRALDRIGVFRLTGSGGTIKKDTYTIDATQGVAGSATIKVDPNIAVDEPGKTAGGIIRVVDVSGNIEDRYRYLSYGTNDVFTLFNLAATADAGGSATSLVDTDGNFVVNGVKIGDIVYDATETKYAYVTAVAATTLTTTNTGSDLPVVDWSLDAYEVGNTVRVYTTSDTAYVPLVDVHEDTGTNGTPGTETAQVTFSANIEVRVRARQAGNILPYEADATVNSNGLTNNIIRAADTIFT